MLDDATHKAQRDEPPPADPAHDGSEEPVFGSLADDVAALLEDGKTYVEAELAFQKTRAGYAGAKTRQGVVHALAALAFLHLALIGLVVGLVIALGPILTPLGAVAAVVGSLMVGVLIFALKARQGFRALGEAFKGTDDETA